MQLPVIVTDADDVLKDDCHMTKEWMQIRVERSTAELLDKIHVERRESYNDIIIRLIHFWQENQKKE